MLNRNSPRPRLGQLIIGGLLTGAIALVLKQGGQTLATNLVYPEVGHRTDDPVDPSLDHLLDPTMDSRS